LIIGGEPHRLQAAEPAILGLAADVPGEGAVALRACLLPDDAGVHAGAGQHSSVERADRDRACGVRVAAGCAGRVVDGSGEVSGREPPAGALRRWSGQHVEAAVVAGR
jgi:hypothetical protein